MRVMTKMRSSGFASVLFFAFTFLLLQLQFVQILVQAVQTLLPDGTIAFHPVGYVFERLGLDPARAPLRLAPARDESGALQDLEVLGDGGQGHGEGLGQLGDRALPLGQTREDRPPRGIGEGGKGGAQAVRRHIIPFGYITKWFNTPSTATC